MRAPYCSRKPLRLAFALVLPVAIAACAPAPLYKTGTAFANATPVQVASSPGNFAGMQTVWGGTVIGVDNRENHTELRILGYPLDSSQRPRLKQPASGRFIAVVPGFLDPMTFPSGIPVTVLGRLDGVQTAAVGGASYPYPVMRVTPEDLHRWTPDEMRQGHPNIHFGVGVGVGIR